MSRRIFTAAGRGLAILATAALIASPAAAQQNAVGINAAVRNEVNILSAATKKVHPAVLRERVVLNDEVRTGAASQLQILLLDRSTFTIGANARIAIDRFVYDPTANARSTSVSVTRGAFRFMSGRALGRPSGSVVVRTPVASIGIRGTIFEGVVGEDAMRIAAAEPTVGRSVAGDKKGASLILLRGPGPRTQGDTIAGAIDVTASGEIVTLDRPDLALYVPRAGARPIGPFQISPAGLQAFNSLLRTTAAPAVGGGSRSKRTRNILLGVGAVAAGVVGGGLLDSKSKKKRPGTKQEQSKPSANRP